MMEIWELAVGIWESATSNLLASFTGLLALVTTASIVVSSINAKKMAIATAESEVLPKIEPGFADRKGKLYFILFYVKDNNVQRPRISMWAKNEQSDVCDKYLEHEQLSDYSGRSKHGDWVLKVTDRKAREFLSDLDSQPPETLTVTLSFESYSGRHYEYTFELMLDYDPDSNGRGYSVDSYSLENQQLPWENVAPWKSLI